MLIFHYSILDEKNSSSSINGGSSNLSKHRKKLVALTRLLEADGLLFIYDFEIFLLGDKSLELMEENEGGERRNGIECQKGSVGGNRCSIFAHDFRSYCLLVFF